MNCDPSPKTLFEKIWDSHVVTELDDDTALLYVDRHFIHDMGGNDALEDIGRRGLSVRNPEKVIAVADHVVSSAPGRLGGNAAWSIRRLDSLEEQSKKWNIRHFGAHDPDQGIIHVMAPELGLTLPGMLLLCGDSHTSTHGALGALAWGIGASEIVHVLATQTIVQRRPKTMLVRFDGPLDPGVEAKDLILALISEIGAAGGVGYAIEYAGETIRRMDVESRMTLCNASIELGAKIGIVAPDEQTFEYVAGRRFAPAGDEAASALSAWRNLKTDDGAKFDRFIVIAAHQISPQITWGTSPEDAMAIDGRVPHRAKTDNAAANRAFAESIEYMGLTPGQPILGLPIDRVFIGSCANSRLSDLQKAAKIVVGRKVAPHVEAWVVPGSQSVKLAAEAEGLDSIFIEAGFQWREPGCSLCVGANGDLVPPGLRCVSSSNRNFMGRQGPGARTHLASPVMAAASAIAGVIADVRVMLNEP